MLFPPSSRSTPGSLPFPGRISHRLGLAVLAFLLLLVAVGGVSSYLAWSILSIAQQIPLQSHHVETTEEIQSNVQRLIHETHRALVHRSLDRESHLQDLTARTAGMISAFLDGHLRDDQPFPEKPDEVALMRRVDALHAEVDTAMTAVLDHVRARAPAGGNELSVLDRAAQELPELAQELKSIHQARIQRLVDAGVARMRLILGAFAAFLVLGGACGAAGIRLFSRGVSSPLRALVSATRGIARGDLTKRVVTGSRDEIGWLSESFNEMARALQQREAALRASQRELQQRVAETRALCRIGVEVASKLDVESILDSVLERARGLLQCQAGALSLFPPTSEASAGWRPARRLEGTPCLGQTPGEAGWVSRSACTTTEQTGPALCLRAALRRGDVVLGILCVGRTEARAFRTEDRTLLEGLAAQAAIAVENARLYREVSSLATVQERERIAREIHDGAAQGVASLHLRLKTLEDRLARGGAPPTLAELADMRAVSKRAYVDVRQSIFGLRTATARNLGLIPMLSEYLREFSRETGIQVEVQDGNPRATDFPPEAEVQLVRVIQEALNNVRRHARARRAWVRFAVDEGDVGRVTVEDDGIGFPAQAVRDASPQRFGLRTMQERTEGVGGRLEVHSRAGRGTQVVIRLPLAKARGAA